MAIRWIHVVLFPPLLVPPSPVASEWRVNASPRNEKEGDRLRP